ncbi:MAG: DUF1045 domain-containing protein [Rhodobacterales bacterium]|nr:DUF1045 domain-containing protein [Rhodobacterales bacterium]
MSNHSRFAVYYAPPPGAFADFGAHWLGWQVEGGRAVVQPAVPNIEALTAAPRKYGFHGTLKPPFRLSDGMTLDGLRAALADLAIRVAPAQADGLVLTRLGHWFALTPTGDTMGIAQVAAACVTELDRFRAPASEAELDKRRKGDLTAAQVAYLTRWGYPYVFDQFRFHLTLTGKVPADAIDGVESQIRACLPALPKPFALAEVCLCGERTDGRFEVLHRYTLTG